MNQYDGRICSSRIRQSRSRLKYVNTNENRYLKNQLPDNNMKSKSTQFPHYCRDYVRFRKNSSRSRSRNNSKSSRRFLSIDYRKQLILFIIQTVALIHFCSIIYCHQRQLSFTIEYLLITITLVNILTYRCVQYDTQQVEHGELLLGESSILFLLWYCGIIGGGLALLIEKHKHLRSRSFTNRLKMAVLLNAIWFFIVYVLYMYRNGFLFSETSSA